MIIFCKYAECNASQSQELALRLRVVLLCLGSPLLVADVGADAVALSGVFISEEADASGEAAAAVSAAAASSTLRSLAGGDVVALAAGRF